MEETLMMKKMLVFGIVVVGFFMASWLWLATAQETPPPAGGRPMPMSPEQMRQRALDRVKETLGATDDEWTALMPKVEKVITVSSEARLRMFGPRRGAPQGAPQLSDVQRLARELQDLLENKDSKPEDIKAKLAALRAARAKAANELKQAQDHLKKSVNERQEAQLVLMGLIE